MRERWTDERLDDLNTKVDLGFERIDRRFEQVDRRFEQMERRFEKIEGDIKELNRNMWIGMVTILAAVLGTGLT